MDEKKLVPKRRFKSFKNEWVEMCLRDLSESFTYGLNAESKEYDGENKYLRITDIDDATRRFDKNDLTSPHIDYEVSSDYILSEGDILFARTGASVGKTYRYDSIDGKVYYAGFLIKTRIKNEHDTEFVFQNTLTKRYKSFVYITSQRSGQPGINAQEYSTFTIFVPTIEEQQKTGEFFKVLDERIANQERKIAKVKDLKLAYLTEMFPQEGETVTKRRFKGCEGKWREVDIGRIGNTFSGLSGKTKKDFGHGTAEFVTYINVFNNTMSDINNTEKVVYDDKETQLKYGDILFTTSSETPDEVGMSSVWLDKRPNVYLNSFCFGFRTNINIDYYFVGYLLRANEFRRKIEILAQGISRYNISKSKVMELKVNLPTIREQQKIGEFFKNFDNQIETEE